MQKRNRLKVSEGTLGLLGKYHRIVLLVVENSGSEGFKIGDLAGLNGLDRARTLKILHDLQQLGLVHAKVRSQSRDGISSKRIMGVLRVKYHCTSESEILSRTKEGYNGRLYQRWYKGYKGYRPRW